MKAAHCRAVVSLATLMLAAAAAVQAQPAANPQEAQRNTRHALIIGIGDYADTSVPRLKGVVHDMASARRMAHAMAIPDANITVLRDQDASVARIRSEITALQGRVGDGDRVFIYYSGHGTRWYDPAQQGDGCTEGLLTSDGSVLTNAELGRRLAPLAKVADKMLVFYDACFSGGVAGAPMRTRALRIGEEAITAKFTRAGSPELCAKPSNFRTRSLARALQEQQAQPQNVVHVAASRPDEVSFDSSTQGGFATAAWRDCLLGQARDLDGSGAITAEEVTRCAQDKVNTGLAGQPGILGQQMTVAGNRSFVPAWMGAAFVAPAASPAASTATAAAAATTATTGTAATAATAAVAVPGAAPSAPAAAPERAATPAQILQELHGQRDGERRVVATSRKQQLKIGVDVLEIDVTPQRDGFLYIAQAGSDGRSLYLLYPNELATDNRVRGGQRVALPGKNWELVAGGPPGAETLLVMVTDAPRDLSALAQEKTGPFMKTLLGGDGRARLQWILSNGTPGKDCGKPGAASCSDAFGAALLKIDTVQ
jgi:hypothetical protein